MEFEIDYVAIGKRIRAARKLKKWTQETLAENAACEPSNISHIERAATKLSLPTLIRIANALDRSLDELVYDNLTKNAHISNAMINELLKDCTPQELSSLVEMLKATKAVLRTKN